MLPDVFEVHALEEVVEDGQGANGGGVHEALRQVGNSLKVVVVVRGLGWLSAS